MSSQFTSGSNGSNKRKASATMDPPEGPPEKKPKPPTALENKLDKLQETLAELQPIWGEYDPGVFMAQMRHMRDRVGKLTPSAIEEFITNGGCNGFSVGLDELDHHLQTPSKDPQLRERTQNNRNAMIAYLERVRQCLKGQS